MTNKKFLSHQDVQKLASELSVKITQCGYLGQKAYPIPRGGVPVAYLLAEMCVIVDNPQDADFFVDDIIDSGSTMKRYCDDFPGKPFLALIDKTDSKCLFKHDWVVFPWESAEKSEDDTIVGTIQNRIKQAGASYFANDNIAKFILPGELDTLQDEVQRRMDSLLRGLVMDVDNDHNTKGTAKRVAKMYLKEVFKGRYLPPPEVTDFPNAKMLDEIYTVGPISIRSACSHHFVPITGKCWIGIIPGERVIGISKFNRVVDWIASRPQIQEEMCVQIADFIEEQIQPIGLAVIVEATHLCMTWRGVKEAETQMRNSIMRGAFLNKPEARAEFMALIK